MEKTISYIPAAPEVPRLLKAAAYTRVSTEKEAMLHSLSAQVSYYNEYIQRRRDWSFAGVFIDEAKTGTKDERPGFQNMLTACREGKIDIVITKSISRFARNTLTTLETVRELAALGVNVYFEREKLYSMSPDGELMLTLLASFAQEESKSVSDNMKWHIRKKFEQGELCNLRFMFGYRINRDGVEIDPEQAEIVRMMFDDYISGMGGAKIAKKLRDMGVVPVFGGRWNAERVLAVIKNEKYTGNALLQKTYIVDHLTKKQVWNKGELAKFYAEETHPAIIDMATFEMAQEIMERRRKQSNNYVGKKSGRYPFTGIITCGQCGAGYKRKIAHKKAYWQCSTYLQEGRDACHAKQIPEEILMAETASVLRLEAFDEKVFERDIESMAVPEANHIVYTFRGGRSLTRIWQDRSRAESWSEEKRQAARERMTPEQREISRQNMNKINEKPANKSQGEK